MSIRSAIHTIFRLFFCDTVRHPTRYPDFFRYRDRYFFQGPIFFGTGTSTFFQDQFFPVPVFFPGTGTIQKRENSRDRDKTDTIWDFFNRLGY